MIIVLLQGGLGNQMFQYSAARALAIQNKTVLKMDLSFLKKGVLSENVDYRNYGLNNFCISENIIEEKELNRFIRISKFCSKFKFSWVNRKTGYKFPIPKIISQKGHGYNKEFNTFSDNTYLIGYWQNINYFSSVKEILKQDFKFKHIPDQYNSEILQKIRDCDSVAVHFRRGDFKNLASLGTIRTDFYFKAFEYVFEKIKNPVLFFFSDEMNWVRDQFNELSFRCNLYYVDGNTQKGSESDDLRLMSKCKHNIIGNSTFGWWGAWLNNNPDKIVIAPEKLFADPSIDNQLQGMIPSDWIRL